MGIVDVIEANESSTYVRNIVPKLRHSKILSEETGFDVGVLDYGICDMKTHKTILTEKLMKRLRERNRKIIFALNPCPDEAEYTNGSLEDALLDSSARNFRESQVISIVDSDRPYSDIKPIHPDFPNSRKRMEVGIPLDHFVGGEELKNFFYNAMVGKHVEGDPLSAWYTSKEMRDVRDFLLTERKINPLDRDLYVDVTNADQRIAYEYPAHLKKGIKDRHTYLVGSIGTGKRFLDQIRNLKGEGIVHIGIVPKGHALDPMHHYRDGYSERLNNPYLVDTLKELIKESAGRKDVIFKYVTDEEAKSAENRLNRVIAKEFPDSVTGHSGAVAASVLKSRFEPKEKLYFNNLGILVPRAYQIEKRDGRYGARRRKLILPYEAGVCIVNTGRSHLGALMQYIAKGCPN